MAEGKNEPKLPSGIYNTKVDLNIDTTPSVPEPESPPPLAPKMEVPRREWGPKFTKYLKSQGRKPQVKIPKIED